jgi:hypothetical protein
MQVRKRFQGLEVIHRAKYKGENCRIDDNAILNKYVHNDKNNIKWMFIWHVLNAYFDY